MKTSAAIKAVVTLSVNIDTKTNHQPLSLLDNLNTVISLKNDDLGLGLGLLTGSLLRSSLERHHHFAHAHTNRHTRTPPHPQRDYRVWISAWRSCMGRGAEGDVCVSGSVCSIPVAETAMSELAKHVIAVTDWWNMIPQNTVILLWISFNIFVCFSHLLFSTIQTFCRWSYPQWL